MSRIFVSYKRLDKEKVFDLKAKIESGTGEKCWIDLDGIESDAQFKNVIIHAIKECEIVLFMYSKRHSQIVDFEKDWTIRELNFAASKNKRIVFINIDNTPLTDEFLFDYSTKQQVDGCSVDAINRLISDINKWLKIEGGKGKPEELVEHPKEPSFFERHRKVLYGTAVSAVAIASLGLGFYFYRIHKCKQDTPIVVNDSIVYHAIDLKLPSGNLWSDVNIGAKKPSDNGHMFTWNDPAADNYGLSKDWAIPSEEDFKELIKYCRWQWVTIDGQNGFKVIGSNGQSIFLPASGWIHDGTEEYHNLYGYYWTADKANAPFARALLFSKTEKKTGNSYITYGRNVRPLRK